MLIGKAANLNESQIQELAKLQRGVAAIYQNEWIEPVLCHIEPHERGLEYSPTQSKHSAKDKASSAALRYLNQRYSAPCREVQAILNDIGTEELAHIEMIGTIIYQLTRDLSLKEIKDSGFDTYFVDHTTGVYPIAASGVPFSAEIFQSTGDAIADIHEDLAAEQKARLTYDNILRLADDPDVRDPIKFLREREIVHYQRFGEGLRLIQDMLDSKNFYAFNPSFDK